MLKEASKFNDFNFRSYFRRRIRDGFKASKGLTDTTEANQQFKLATENLELIKRQTTLSQLFDTTKPLSIEVSPQGVSK